MQRICLLAAAFVAISSPQLAMAASKNVVSAPAKTALTPPEDPLRQSVVIDGPPVTVNALQPGRPVVLSFHARKGQRLGLGIAGLTHQPVSASGIALVIRAPDGRLLPGGERIFCLPPTAANAEGNCDAEFTIASTGAHAIEVDTPFSTTSRFTVSLSTPVARRLSIGKAEAVTLSRIGQEARLSIELPSADEVSVEVRDVASTPAERPFAIRAYRPDGTVQAQGTATSARGASIGLGGKPGTYVVEIDPAHGAYGSFVALAKASASIGMADPPREFSSKNPSDIVRFGMQVRAGQSFTVSVSSMKLTPDGEHGNSVLAVNKPDGTRLAGLGCTTQWWVPCKLVLRNLAEAGKYTIAISPPPGGNVAGTLILGDISSAEIARDTPVHVEIKPAGVARYSFPGTAGEAVTIGLANIVSTNPNAVTLRIERPEGHATFTQTAMQGAITTKPYKLPVTGTYAIVIDPGLGAITSADLAMTKEQKQP